VSIFFFHSLQFSENSSLLDFSLSSFNELDNLNVGWVIRVLVNLHSGGESWSWPLLLAKWLAMHVPVGVWSFRSISWFSVAVLVLRDLVLMIDKCLARLHDIVVNLTRFPVSVVVAILCFVLCRRRWLIDAIDTG